MRMVVMVLVRPMGVVPVVVVVAMVNVPAEATQRHTQRNKTDMWSSPNATCTSNVERRAGKRRTAYHLVAALSLSLALICTPSDRSWASAPSVPSFLVCSAAVTVSVSSAESSGWAPRTRRLFDVL